MLFSDSNLSTKKDIKTKLDSTIPKVSYLEEAAQILCEEICNQFSESVVLARIFATVLYRDLPDINKAAVEKLTTSVNLRDLLKDDTIVLSLLGTHGKDPQWNDRKNSNGHIGVPLLSPEFIHEIPMMSRLLKEIGVDVSFLKNRDSNIVAKSAKLMGGVFYVKDAKTEVDELGRKIIANQQFVQEKNINTVFGFAGNYLGKNLFFSSIVFSNETIEKSVVENISLLANDFKTLTRDFIAKGKIFRD